MGTGLPVLPLNQLRSGAKELVTAAVLPAPWGFTPPGSATLLRCLSPPTSHRCGFRAFTVMEHGSAFKFPSLPPSPPGSLFFRRAIVVCRKITLNFSSARAFWSLFRLLLHISSSDSISATEFRLIWGTSPSGNSFLQCFANSSCSHIAPFRRLPAESSPPHPRAPSVFFLQLAARPDIRCLSLPWFLRTRSILSWPHSANFYLPTHGNRSRARNVGVRRGEVRLWAESFPTSCIEKCCFQVRLGKKKPMTIILWQHIGFS